MRIQRQPSPGPSWTTLPVTHSSSPMLWGDSDDEEQLLSSSQSSPNKESEKKRKALSSFSIDRSPIRARVAVKESTAPSDVINITSSSDESFPSPRTPTSRGKPLQAGTPSPSQRASNATSAKLTKLHTGKNIRNDPSSASPSISHCVEQATPSKKNHRTSLNLAQGEPQRPPTTHVNSAFKDVPYIDFTKVTDSSLSRSSSRKRVRQHSNASSVPQSPCVRSTTNAESTKHPSPLSKPRTAAPPVSYPSTSKTPSSFRLSGAADTTTPSSIKQSADTCRPTKKSKTLIDTPGPTPNASSILYPFPSAKPADVECIEPPGKRALSRDNLSPVCSRYPSPAKTLPSHSPVVEKAELLFPVEGATVSMNSGEGKSISVREGSCVGALPQKVDNSLGGVVEKSRGQSAPENLSEKCRSGGVRRPSLTDMIFARSCAWVGHDLTPYRGTTSASPTLVETPSPSLSSPPFMPTQSPRANAGLVSAHLPTPVSPVIPSAVPKGWEITNEQIENMKEVIRQALAEPQEELGYSSGSELELQYPSGPDSD